MCIRTVSSWNHGLLLISLPPLLQVWHVDGDAKTPLSDSNISKFYSGDCYIFQYTYPGDSGEEYIIGTWFGNQSVEVITAYASN